MMVTFAQMLQQTNHQITPCSPSHKIACKCFRSVTVGFSIQQEMQRSVRVQDAPALQDKMCMRKASAKDNRLLPQHEDFKKERRRCIATSSIGRTTMVSACRPHGHLVQYLSSFFSATSLSFLIKQQPRSDHSPSFEPCLLDSRSLQHSLTFSAWQSTCVAALLHDV